MAWPRSLSVALCAGVGTPSEQSPLRGSQKNNSREGSQAQERNPPRCGGGVHCQARPRRGLHGPNLDRSPLLSIAAAPATATVTPDPSWRLSTGQPHHARCRERAGTPKAIDDQLRQPDSAVLTGSAARPMIDGARRRNAGSQSGGTAGRNRPSASYSCHDNVWQLCYNG